MNHASRWAAALAATAVVLAGTACAPLPRERGDVRSVPSRSEPPLARAERLLDEGEDEVVLVVCQPDRPKGRRKKLEAPPVKALAEARGIPVAQPKKLRDGALAARLVEEKAWRSPALHWVASTALAGARSNGCNENVDGRDV